MFVANLHIKLCNYLRVKLCSNMLLCFKRRLKSVKLNHFALADAVVTAQQTLKKVYMKQIENY